MEETTGKAINLYETYKRKVQKDRKILVRKLQADKRKRPSFYGYVCSCHAGIRLVGTSRTLKLINCPSQILILTRAYTFFNPNRKDFNTKSFLLTGALLPHCSQYKGANDSYE